jgi:hypothetical protein
MGMVDIEIQTTGVLNSARETTQRLGDAQFQLYTIQINATGRTVCLGQNAVICVWTERRDKRWLVE